MLNKANALTGHSLQNTDGETIGKVKEFYFDDRHWTIRYLVADTGNWLTCRQVLISPYAVLAVNRDENGIVVNLTKKQIEGSPSADSAKPVSRQLERSYCEYYGWPMYWGGPFSWGPYPSPIRDRSKWGAVTPGENAWDPDLRSTHAVSGHHIQATDGEIGHVEDFLIDDETWTIRYLIVSTRNWWPGKKILISPQWIERVSWSEAKVFVGLSRETINHAPEYTNESLLSRDYETGLYRHYNRPGYWVDDQVGAPHSSAITPQSMKTDESPKNRDPVRVPDQKTDTKGRPLVDSPAIAEREIAGLRRGDAEREAAPTAGETNVRTTLI